MSWTLEQGKRYRIKVSLSWVESFAPDGMIKSKFTENGFSNVSVEDEDDGKVRIVEGTWNHPTKVIPKDSHLSELEAIALH
jgi:hypothetical protein